MNKRAGLGLLLLAVAATGCLYPSLKTASGTGDADSGVTIASGSGGTTGADLAIGGGRDVVVQDAPVFSQDAPAYGAGGTASDGFAGRGGTNAGGSAGGTGSGGLTGAVDAPISTGGLGGVAVTAGTLAWGGALGKGGMVGTSGVSSGGTVTRAGGAGGDATGVVVSTGGIGTAGTTQTVRGGSQGTGGFISTGGVVGTGGTNGTGGATISCSGLTIPTVAGKLSVSSPWAYVTVGPLHGWGDAYTWLTSNSTTCITPTCGNGCTPSIGTTSLCAAGIVTADATNNSAAGIGMSLKQTETSSLGSIQISGSITLTDSISSSSTGNLALRAELIALDGTSFCVEAGHWTSGVSIPIGAFNTACWDNSGTYASASTAVAKVALIVPSSVTEDRPFSFCLTNVTVQPPSPICISASQGTCANAGYVYCSGSACCSTSYPYYCPSTNQCYPSAAAADEACGSTTCTACNGGGPVGGAGGSAGIDAGVVDGGAGGSAGIDAAIYYEIDAQ